MQEAYREELKELQSYLDALEETARKGEVYWRASYTPEDAKGVRLLQGWMEQAGLATRFDDVGNLIGRLEGGSPEVILAGSHRDTVCNGGKYDGALGVISALVAAEALGKELGRPRKTLEVIAMVEEEGSRFHHAFTGSHSLTGTLTEAQLEERDVEGISLREAMQAAGYPGKNEDTLRRDIQRTVEMHIEQGGLLEARGQQVGLVEAIVGMCNGELIFHGEQNHAGTTLMSIRKDPVPAAADFILKMTAWARSKGEQVVTTFGEMSVSPGRSNVIPAYCKLSYDIRSTKKEEMEEGLARLRELGEELPEGISLEILPAGFTDPADMDEEGLARLEEIAKAQGLAYRRMHSGAGHDSQLFAKVYRSNMIFVPSHRGISHSREEYTALEDIAPGYGLLRAFLKELAW